MIKILLTIIIVLANLLISAQKCKSTYDEFEKKTTVQTGFDKIGSFKSGGLSGKYFLQGTLSATDTTHYILGLIPEFSSLQAFDKDDEVTLLFTNGETLKLYVGLTSISRAKAGKAFSQGSGTRIYSNSLLFIVDGDSVETLKNNTIKKIRFNSYDFDVSEGDYFQKAIACISKTMNK